MREKTVEKNYCERVAAAGGVSLKFVSPGRKNVPDRLTLLGTGYASDIVKQLADSCGVRLSAAERFRWARRIVAASVQFAEIKAPGKKPTKAQEREHERLRAMGYKVDVVDG